MPNTWAMLTRHLGIPTGRPRVQFVRAGDDNLGAIIAWAVQFLPGARGVTVLGGLLQVEQVFSGWLEPTGVVGGEVRYVIEKPGVVSVRFDAEAREATVWRRIRYEEVPAELWGPLVA